MCAVDILDLDKFRLVDIIKITLLDTKHSSIHTEMATPKSLKLDNCSILTQRHDDKRDQYAASRFPVVR